MFTRIKNKHTFIHSQYFKVVRMLAQGFTLYMRMEIIHMIRKENVREYQDTYSSRISSKRKRDMFQFLGLVEMSAVDSKVTPNTVLSPHQLYESDSLGNWWGDRGGEVERKQRGKDMGDTYD